LLAALCFELDGQNISRGKAIEYELKGTRYDPHLTQLVFMEVTPNEMINPIMIDN
jgi:hypothetical protein